MREGDGAMAVAKKKTSKTRVSTVAQKKAMPKKAAPEKVAKPAKMPVKQETAKKLIPVALKPTAQTCPLVLDGIVLAEDFSPRECFSCDEFDCRFYSAEESSGLLGSRLFAGGEAGDEEDEDADLFGSERGEDDASLWGDEEDE
jgi:hypothetical protein